MKRKNIILAMILMFLLLFLGGKMIFDRDSDLFEEIIKETDSSVLEYGIRVSFTKDSFEDTELIASLKAMGYSDGNITAVKMPDTYTLDFVKGQTYGYLEAVKEEDKTLVTIDVKEKGPANNIGSIKESIEKAMNKSYKDLKYSLYLKAGLKGNDIAEVNNQVKNLLKARGVKNLETVKLSNGFSSVANTGSYTPIKSSGVLTDFNYAVATYDTGSYIIMGTPIIKESY